VAQAAASGLPPTPAPLVRYAPALAAALAFAVFLPSLKGAFLYDDLSVVVENRSIRDLTQWRAILLHEPSRPLLNLSWALNYAVSGLRPWSYHLLNVALHAGNAALLASLLLFLAARHKRLPTPMEAAVTALFFAVNPMAVETVAYVASRSSALATFFGLATLRLAAPALLEGSWRRLGLATLCYVLALATKEEAASIPLMLLLLDFFFLRGPEGKESRQRILMHAPFWVLPAMGLVLRRAVTGEWLPTNPEIGRGAYLWTQWTVFPLYFVRALVPLDPAFFRGQPAAWPVTPGAVLVGLLTAALVVSAIVWRRRWPEWTLAIAWLAAGLLPSSSLVPLAEMAVDHRAYLGCAFALLLVARLVLRPRAPALVGAVLVVLAGLTLRYEWILGDPVRAWEDAVARAPRAAEAHRGLAEAYAGKGDPRAEATLRDAVRLDPNDAKSWTNLGVLYAESRRYPDSIEALRAASRAAPSDPRIHDNLGLLLKIVGRVDEAAAAFETAIRLDPRLAQPRLNLAEILVERGDRERARRLVDEAAGLEIDPQDAALIESLRERMKAAADGGAGR
jgi:hypothetical protein